MPRKIDFIHTLKPKTLVHMLMEEIDETEALIVIRAPKNGPMHIAWSEMPLKDLLFMMRLAHLDIDDCIRSHAAIEDDKPDEIS